MDSRKYQKLESLLHNNWELRKLLEKQKEIERKLQRLGSLSFRTTDEQVEEKYLKRTRLAAKERMVSILSKSGLEEIVI